METGIKSSFIPQSPIMPSIAPSRRGGSGGGFDFFILVSLVVFVASATLGAGVFLYAQFLEKSAASKLEQLERAKQAFDPALIAEMTRLDDRMRAADTILAEHIAPTTLFSLLEKLTLQTVSFSSFAFESADDKTRVNMVGLAQSVNSIALQADLMSKSGALSNPIFSNINRQIGGVRFDFSTNVNVESLKYSLTLQLPEAEAAAPELAPPSVFGTPGEPVQQP